MINLKNYQWSKVLETQASTVTFDIPEYSAGDVISVYVNGFHQTPETDYTIDGNTITFISGSGIKTAGTEISVVCSKVITETAADPITDDEILRRVRAALGYTFNFQDDDANKVINEQIKIFIDDMKFYMEDAGVPVNVINSSKGVGCIVRGVIDTMNYNSGTIKLSPFCYERICQLATGVKGDV